MPKSCPICHEEAPHVFRHRVLQTAWADIHLCPACDYLFAADPDWLDTAYQRVINTLDTGCLARTEALIKQTALPIYLLAGQRGYWLDYGGGHGCYVRRMRDTGFDFRWQDPMAENLFAAGFADEGEVKYDGITCFECLEHFTNPVREVEMMLSRGPRIIFSTELRPERIPRPNDWWYYAWEHGQHIGFHSRQSLSVLAKNFGLSLVSNGHSLHAFLPHQEVDSPAARFITKGNLPLSAWSLPALRKVFSLKAFIQTLYRFKIYPEDILEDLNRFLGSKTWSDHVSLKEGERSQIPR